MILPDYNPGIYTMEVTIGTSSNWAARGTATFTVIKTLTDTQITSVETVNGEVGNTIVPITITDTNGGALDGSPLINVKDGDTLLLENYTVENGVANISVPTTRTGDYDLSVEVVTNAYFNGCNATIPVSVSKAPTTLIVDQYAESDYHSINVLYNTLLTGKLLQTSNNNPIKNAEITLKVNKTNVIITTDDEGKFEYKYDVTNLGICLLSIAYNGDDLYLATEEQLEIFEIKSLESNIALDEDPLSEVNETTTISGTLTDDSNNPVPNAEINLEITGVEDTVTVTTDSEGKFSYDIIYNDVAEITVTASMKNQVLYTAENKTMTFNVVVGPRRTNLTIETGSGTGTNINIIDITPYHNELITNGTLLDIFKEPVADATIKIQINGEDFSQTTDSEGKFTLIYNATEGLTAYNINVQFEGNDAYKPAGEVYTGTFTTEAFDIKVTLDENFPEEILIGDVITLTGSATLQNETLKNNPIVLTIDNTKYTISTDEEGKYTYDYTVARNGTIPVIANATFANAAVTLGQTSFFVAKPVVNIDLDEIEDTKVYSDITLNGKIYIAQNDTPIQDELILKVNGESIDLSSNEDGTFNYVYTPTEAGTYDIVISYGNVKYAVQNATAQVKATQRKTQIISDKLPIAAKVNDLFTISGTLVDEENNPIADAEMIFIINDETFTNNTDADGRYAYNYLATEISDDNPYEVKYNGDDNYAFAKNFVGSFFDVETSKAYITVEAREVCINMPTTITGTVTDKNNKVLANINVTVEVLKEVIEVITNENGVYTASYVLPKVGAYPIIAKITDERYLESTATTEANVIKTTTTTTIKDMKANADYQANLTAEIFDSNNKALTTGKVVFKVNGKTVKDANGKVIYTKISNGQAVLPYTFTQEDIDNNVTISAAYSGSANYEASQSQKVNITISDHDITMTLNDITSKAGETITIITTIKDHDENINTGKVIFKINGKTIKDANGKVVYINVADGQANYDYTLPETMKTRNYTLSAVFIATDYNRTETNSQLVITTDSEGNGSDTPTNTHIITNNNVNQYITKNGLASRVSDGDTLDIQGSIRRDSGISAILINKPVNIITSTNDGRIEDLDEITFNKASSGSNVTGLFTYNTQFYIKNANHIILDNITNYVSGKIVGTNVGQTSIRENSSYITVKNSYIYTNNTKSSSLVFAWADNCIVDNCTVKVEGEAGNLIYFTYYNVNIPSSVPANKNNTVRNCTLISLSTNQVICYAIAIAGYDIRIEDCDITYKGTGITIQSAAGSNNRGETVNITIVNNKLHGGCGIGAVGNATIRNNMIYDNGPITTGLNSTVYNNTVSGTVTVYLANSTVENNIIGNAVVYSGRTLNNNIINGNIVANTSTIISNNTITGTVTVSSNAQILNNTVNGQISLSINKNTVNNAIIANNTVNGNIVSTGSSVTSLNNGNNLTGNTIRGNITLSNSGNTLIKNNTINGTVNVINTATGTIITQNIINTTNNYAITAQNRLTTISNNTLIANGKQGNNAISGVSGINITDNGPKSSDFWKISIDLEKATVGENTMITVNLIDEINNVPINEGEVYLMINDEVITDENDNPLIEMVSSSMAIFEISNVPTEWLRSDTVLTAVFTNNEIVKTDSIYMNIVKRDALVEITTDDLTITPGQTVTLIARVTDMKDNSLLNGRLTFKLDGVSLEDNEGQILVVDVVDGIATVEYTLPIDITTGTYSLSAVFENTYYKRSSDETTLIIG